VLRALGLVEQGGPSVPRRIVFISVNSERVIDLSLDNSDEVPSSFAVLDALVYAGQGRSSKETSLLFSDAVAPWRSEIQMSPDLGSDSDVDSIELKLGDVVDSKLREQLLGIPRTFRISKAQQEALREAARQTLAVSGEFRRLRESVRQNR
jgi:hypothetical protein